MAAPTNESLNDRSFKYKGYDCVILRVVWYPALMYSCAVERNGKVVGRLKGVMPLAVARKEAKSFCDAHYANNYSADSDPTLNDKPSSYSDEDKIIKDLQLRVAALEKKVVMIGFGVIAVALLAGYMFMNKKESSSSAIPPTPAPVPSV